jgi:transposase InsO family protein
MVHRNARPTPAGRTILVQRVLQGRPVDHVAKEMGVSHTCAHRWFRRYFEHGWAGMEDRYYRPGSCPHTTAEAKTQEVLAARVKHREGTVSGERIRARRATDHRYDRDTTGALLPIDVTKPGPHPRRWRLAGPWPARGRGIGYDYVHVAVDDHSRPAYVEVLPDEKDPSCARFLSNAAAFIAASGAPVQASGAPVQASGAPVQEVMADNALACIRSAALATALADPGAKHRRTKPRSPRQNGKAERFNRTLQEGRAHKNAYDSSDHRTQARTGWPGFDNHRRNHSALAGPPPISRCNQPPGRVHLDGEKSFAHSVLETTDVAPSELRGPGLISVDNRTEQPHMLMHMTGEVGKAIQDHAPDSCREIVVANQDIFEVGIGGGRVNALVHTGIEAQGFNDGGRICVERLDGLHDGPQLLPHRLRRHASSAGGGKRLKLGADLGNKRKISDLHPRRESAPPRIRNYQAIQLQPLKGFSHRSPADAKVLGEVIVIEQVPGLDVKHQQPVPDALVRHVGQRLLDHVFRACRSFNCHNPDPFPFKSNRLLTSPTDQYTLTQT